MMRANRPACWLGLVMSSLVVVTSAAHAQTHPRAITLATVADSREVDVGVNVLLEAYSRIGVTVSVRRLPGDMALQASNAGEVAGEVHRIDGIMERFPNLVQVPVPINYFDIAVYSRNPAFRPAVWRDLAPLRIGVVRGVLAIEQATRGMKVRQVDTYEELFPLLVRGEVDAIAAPVVAALDAIKRHPELTGIAQNAILDSYLLYHYLHRDHAFLIPVIQPVLMAMLRDGTTASIRERTYADLAPVRAAMER